MRKLNTKQREILIRREETDYDDLPEIIRNAVEKINWYESLWSDVNRFLSDCATERLKLRRDRW